MSTQPSMATPVSQRGVTSHFEAAWLKGVQDLVSDPSFVFAWDRAPAGSPRPGIKEVVFQDIPGGERQVTSTGMSGSYTRKIQVSIFATERQDSKDAAMAIHGTLDNLLWLLEDGSQVRVIPAMQDAGRYDDTQKVHQVVFDYLVFVTETNETELIVDGGTF